MLTKKGRVLNFLIQHKGQKFKSKNIENILFPHPNRYRFPVGTITHLLFKDGKIKREVIPGKSYNRYWVD